MVSLNGTQPLRRLQASSRLRLNDVRRNTFVQPTMAGIGMGSGTTAEWQLVVVLWGNKYGVTEVSQLVEAVRAHSNRPFRAVLITDRIRDDIPDTVEQRLLPDLFMAPELQNSGCQAKLAMFEKGLLWPDLPAIFVDIDTVIFGDLSRLLPVPETRKTIALLQSGLLPIGGIARFMARLSGGKRGARGNSSIVVFHPKECSYVADRFKELHAKHGVEGFRPLTADDRFVSWVAQENLQAVPNTLAVKFPGEFMLSWRWLIYLRASLPWIQKRWEGLVAVTLPGVVAKGQDLLALHDGQEIVDRRGRRLIWSDRAIGPMKQHLTDYYTALAAREKENDT